MSCAGWASYSGPCGATDCDNCYPGCSDRVDADETVYLFETSTGELAMSRGNLVVLGVERASGSFRDASDDWDHWSDAAPKTTTLDAAPAIGELIAECHPVYGIDVVSGAGQAAALFLGDE